MSANVVGVLRASTCDWLAAVAPLGLVAAATSKKVYFVSTTVASTHAEGVSDDFSSSQGSSGTLSQQSNGISLPSSSRPFCVTACASHAIVVTVAATNPRQLEAHDETGCIVTDLLAVEAAAPIQQLDIHHDVLVVRSAAASDTQTSIQFYRADSSTPAAKGCLRHLGSCVMPISTSEAESAQWLAEVSPATSGIQEAVVVGVIEEAISSSKGSGAGTAPVAHITVLDISGTVASQRASTAIPWPAGSTIATWTTSWTRRELHILASVAGGKKNTPAALKWLTARLSGASLSRAWTESVLPAAWNTIVTPTTSFQDICATVNGAVWAAVTDETSSSSMLIELLSPLSTTSSSKQAIKSDQPPVTLEDACSTIRLATVGASSIIILHGKKILRMETAVATSSTNAANHVDPVPAVSTASAEDILRGLFTTCGAKSTPATQQQPKPKSSRSGSVPPPEPTTTAGGATVVLAEKWVTYLLASPAQSTTSPRPSVLLRDADYLAAKTSTTQRSPHAILDRLLASKGASAADAVLRYLHACSGALEATSVLRILSSPSCEGPSFQFAVWVIVSQSDGFDVPHFTRQLMQHLRREKLGAATAVRLFHTTADAIDAALATNRFAEVALGSALADAISVVHGAELATTGGDATRAVWARLVATMSGFSKWGLEWAAPAIGQITAHCGVPLQATKEAQFFPHTARRIRKSREADIHRSTVVLAAPSVARANKRQ